MGDIEEARIAYQNAAASGHPEAAARSAFQRAIDPGYPEIAAVASLGLGWLLAGRGDVAAARDAFQHAAHSEYPPIAEEAVRNLQALPLARQASESKLEQTLHPGPGQHGAIPADSLKAGNPARRRTTDLTDGNKQVNME